FRGIRSLCRYARAEMESGKGRKLSWQDATSPRSLYLSNTAAPAARTEQRFPEEYRWPRLPVRADATGCVSPAPQRRQAMVLRSDILSRSCPFLLARLSRQSSHFNRYWRKPEKRHK